MYIFHLENTHRSEIQLGVFKNQVLQVMGHGAQYSKGLKGNNRIRSVKLGVQDVRAKKRRDHQEG